jgi:hypothetical protein
VPRLVRREDTHVDLDPAAPQRIARRNANETPDPVRPDAVDPRFHGVRQQADRHDQLKLTGTTVLMVLM